MIEQIMNILVCFYFFLEIYVFVYSQELKIKSYYQYHEEVAEQLKQLNCMVQDESIIEFVQPDLSKTELETIPATISELDEDTINLFEEIEKALEVNSKEYENENYSVYDFEDEKAVIEDDCISIEDLENEEPVTSTGYESFASAKIADEIDGPQQWVVSIVGMEDTYIHITDGKRIWVNVGEKVHKLKNGDILILDVVRNGKEVLVENLFRLESTVSEEYIIPDEMHHRIA
ncbi:hypothetical protein [Neobacillus sp.]|uniref:hypothetical protein n=1 Tax=Neobacillus sp. TaxID=2675273 RepID=UPI0035B53966